MKNTLRKITNIKLALLLIITGSFLTVSAQAATFTVDRTDNVNVSTCTAAANDCTLRGAITAANAAATDDVIDFDPAVFNVDTTIALSAGNLLPNIANNGTLTINAPTAIRVTVSGSNAVRVFNINTGAIFEVNNLTVANGNNGGGILNNGTLTLTNCTLDNNVGSNGGGISNAGTLSITNCTLSNNRATGSGGAIFNSAASGNTITINNSTLSGNTATGGSGGAISNISTTTVTFNNSTISGNSAGNIGGGVRSDSGGTVILDSTTLSGNSAGAASNPGGGVSAINSGTITLNNSIVANSSGGDCAVSAGGGVNATYSLIESGLTCVNGTNSNNLTGDPNLGALANNGGATQTHELLAGSIAIDKGNSALMTDQRGSFRPVDSSGIPNAPGGNGADIGSFEIQTVTAASVSIGGRVLSGKRGVSNATVYLTDQNGSIRTARTNSFGYYRFYDVEVGQTLILNVFHKQYQFSQQVVSVMEEISELNFTADHSLLQEVK